MAYPGYQGFGAPQPSYGQYYGGTPGYGAPGGMPGYGAGYGGDIGSYFSAVAGVDQQIDPTELQQCLSNSGIAGNYRQFSLETCRLMICMLDRDYSGKMGFQEFQELWGALNQWKQTFMTYDRDRSGTVEPFELQQAIASWGYRLTPQALNVVVKRYSEAGRIKFDDFIAAAIRLRMLTESFRRRDHTQTGHANFPYDDPVLIPPPNPGHSESSFGEVDENFDISDLPVKLELRYAIEAKRAEQGLNLPVIEDISNRSRELSFEEDDRRRARRERNKVAASRCRTKRKHHVRILLKESEELAKSNSCLEVEIAHLKQERHELEEAIRKHDCKSAERRSDPRCPGS